MSEQFNQIGQALAAANDPTPEVRTKSEAFLQHAETQVHGYYSMLQQIYMTEEYDTAIRLSAAIAFKNGIDKYWRKAAKNCIPDAEKDNIRKSLLSDFACEASVRRQVAVAVAKVARLDYPASWPTLFEDLLQLISNAESDDKVLAHSETMYQVIKTMASSRLGRARFDFQTIAPTVMRYLLASYQHYSHRWIHESATALDIKISDVALKTARRVVCHGFEMPYQHELCRQFFSLLASQIRPIWSILSTQKGRTKHEPSVYEPLCKHLLHVGKFFIALSASAMETVSINHSFVLMPGSLEVVGTYWELALALADTDEETLRKVVIHGLVLLKQCIKLSATPEWHLRVMGENERLGISKSIELLNKDFFSSTALTGILEGLILKFLVLSSTELNLYKHDSENWLLTQDESHWQLDIRPCAEKVLHDLFAQYKQELAGLLLNVLASTADQLSGDGLLMKEAMYNALGVAAPHLFESFDFDSFLDRLVAELTTQNISPLFRRRVVILVVQWASVKCSAQRKPLVYQIIGSVLQDRGSAEAFGAALSAAFAVPTLIDAWEWDSTDFGPFAPGYIESLVQILAECEEVESKMKIVPAIGMIYERIDRKIPTRLELVLEQIPREWDTEEGEHLLRVALLGLLSRLALTCRLNSSQGYAIVMPLIAYSTDSSNFEYVYLVEEALELWHAILQNALAPDESLLQLIPILGKPTMLPEASDNLAKILSLIESNLLLFRREQISFALLQSLLQKMVMMLPDLETKAVSHFTKVLELGVQILSPESLYDEQLWLLTEVLLRDSSDTVTTVCILCLLCQITLSDLPRIARFWQQSPKGDVTERVIKVIFDKFDNLGQAKRRKACALALTALVTTRHPIFQDENVLAGLGNIWSDVLAEVQPHAGNDLIYWVDDSILLEDVIPDSAEAQRRKQVMETDPVCTIALRECVRNGSQYVNTQLLGVDLASFLT